MFENKSAEHKRDIDKLTQQNEELSNSETIQKLKIKD